MKESSKRNEKYSYNLYDRATNKKLVKMVGHCMHCGQPEVIKESKKYKRKYSNLNVHHIDGDKTNNCFDNLTILCNKCHQGKAHICIKNTDGRIFTQVLNLDMKFKPVSKVILKSKKVLEHVK